MICQDCQEKVYSNFAITIYFLHKLLDFWGLKNPEIRLIFCHWKILKSDAQIFFKEEGRIAIEDWFR